MIKYDIIYDNCTDNIAQKGSREETAMDLNMFDRVYLRRKAFFPMMVAVVSVAMIGGAIFAYFDPNEAAQGSPLLILAVFGLVAILAISGRFYKKFNDELTQADDVFRVHHAFYRALKSAIANSKDGKYSRQWFDPADMVLSISVFRDGEHPVFRLEIAKAGAQTQVWFVSRADVSFEMDGKLRPLPLDSLRQVKIFTAGISGQVAMKAA